MNKKLNLLTMIATGVIMGATSISFAQSAQSRQANIECRASDGAGYVWLDTQTHQMWLGKDDSNINQALQLTTTSWTSNGPLSLVGIGTMQMGWMGTANYKMAITPKDSSHGTLVITLSSAKDNSSETLPPETCVLLN